MSKEQNEKNFITSSNSGGGLEPPTSSWLAVTITSVCMVTTAMVRHSNTVINASSFSTFHLGIPTHRATHKHNQCSPTYSIVARRPSRRVIHRALHTNSQSHTASSAIARISTHSGGPASCSRWSCSRIASHSPLLSPWQNHLFIRVYTHTTVHTHTQYPRG